jgi:hypothetical protein
LPHWKIDCSNLKCGSERSTKGMTNSNQWGVYAKCHPEANNPSFTHLVRGSMSPIVCKFAQSGRVRQYQPGARQLRTLKEKVGVVRATELLRPGSNRLPFERAAALLKTACIAFCRPCLSGRNLAVNIVTCNSFKLELYIPTWYYSKMV